MPVATEYAGEFLIPTQKRLRQYAAWIVAGGLYAAWNTGADDTQAWVVLMAGALALGIALLLGYFGRPRAASGLLWGATITVAGILAWQRHAQEAALIVLPVAFAGLGLVLQPRYLIPLFVVAVGLLASAAAPYSQTSVCMLLIAGGIAWLQRQDMLGEIRRLHIQLADVHQDESSLTYIAQHDLLTQLPNREYGASLLEQGMAISRENNAQMALLFVDLDNFKDINDSLGHATGDQFLRVVVQRLRDATRSTDILCRHGGDEFLVGLINVISQDDVTAIAKNVLASISRPCLLRDTEIVSSCSIGIAMHPAHGIRYEDLMRHADLAMYQAKEAGRNTYKYFSEEMTVRASENLYLISTLRAAIAQNEFILMYQPVLNLQTGTVVGAEALVRWQNPKLGLVSPGLFIPAAEKSGIIVDIGQWVIEQACRQMKTWHDQGAPPLTISVNLSPVQFQRGDVEIVIENALKVSGLAPQYLELEVTESTLVQDTERFIQSLQRIKSLGIHIAIDDFGTGYSNLSYLQRFAIDKLKIDQSFVKRLLNSRQDMAIVGAIIQMARSLNLTTTAEGVEDLATRDLLTTLGCDLAQGYFFARPLTPEKFETFMNHNLGADATISPGIVA